MTSLAQVDMILTPPLPLRFTCAEIDADPYRHQQQPGTLHQLYEPAGLRRLALPAGQHSNGLALWHHPLRPRL